MQYILEFIFNFLVSPGIPKKQETRTIMILFVIIVALLLGTKMYNLYYV